jgi:mannose-6-phosphate isomerase-like protein (cupin superfamily)
MSIEAIDLHRKLTLFNDHRSPCTVAEYNDHDVMVVKVQGEFQRYSHADSDDFFLVLRGELQIDFRGGQEGTVTLGPGQMFIVPKGVEHRPRAVGEVTCC